MSAALKLFADLGITYVPPNQQRRRGPMETSCIGIVDRMIRKFGPPHATITLRTIVESKGNESALIADIVDGVSDLILAHPRWPNLGLRFIEAFDQINLAEIRKTAKAANVQPLRVAVATLIAVELEKFLGPSRLPKLPRPSKADIVRDRLALGVALLDLKAAEPERFGALAFERFKIDPKCATVDRTITTSATFSPLPRIAKVVGWGNVNRLSCAVTK
jgi:hypothetical protein